MYYVYPKLNVIHKENCDNLPPDGIPKRYQNLKSLLKRGYYPCRCTQKDLHILLRERNKCIVDREKFNFIFTPKSDVFHSTDCGAILAAREIKGSYYYQSCLLTGRRPCKLCNPMDSISVVHEGSVSSEEILRIRAEERAIKRHKQALIDRTALENNIYLPLDKKEDLYTLSTSSFTFFASKGYETFHLRNCKKITNLQNLEGFSTYENACRAGYKPCRYCKPTTRHNNILSLPIYSTERDDESKIELREFCKMNGFTYMENCEYVYVETSVGIWRMNITKKPYHLEHINLNKTPDNREIFHQQPKLFLSMIDALYYIKRHDNVLNFVWNEREYVPVQDKSEVGKENKNEN